MNNLVGQQRLQFAHDANNHQDIHCLSRIDRLKHYGLHYAKYCGRLTREDGGDARMKTMVDWMLVALSASVALQDKLDDLDGTSSQTHPNDLPAIFKRFCDATGRFGDACEKIDHLEPFREIAVSSNRDLVACLLGEFSRMGIDLDDALEARRAQLRDRAFYSAG